MTLPVRFAWLESGVIRAWCPALPGCVVTAESWPEAKRVLNDAIEGYLASMNIALPRNPLCLPAADGSDTK